MTQAAKRLPAEIIAIDWGATAAKRQLCRAVRRGGRYSVDKPERIAEPSALELPDDSLVAFDCPLGLPEVFANRLELAGFREGLAQFGRDGALERFYQPAGSPEEISFERPFYPTKSPGAKREHLTHALGESAFALRACDRATGGGPLFWLVGAQQVGRSAISVWRDVLAPRLEKLSLWPFDGPLDVLLAKECPVVAELYPAFLRRIFGWELGSKRDGAARAETGRRVVEETRDVGLIAVRDLLLDGFGPSPDGEDAFDAVTSCVALVRLLLGDRLPEPPDDVRAVEGWILGL